MILIAIGANLPGLRGETPLETCEQAVAALRELPDMQFRALSSWYRTAPVPRSDQPDYCNGIIRFEGNVDPALLLAVLHRIEERFGRARSVPGAARTLGVGAARTLDLDIIDINGIIRMIPSPVLPHPRAHQRVFVLRPILDVAPSWRHPTLRRGVTSLLVDLPQQAIEPWDSGGG